MYLVTGSSLGEAGTITSVSHLSCLLEMGGGMGGYGVDFADTEEGAIPQHHCLASARTKTGSEGD